MSVRAGVVTGIGPIRVTSDGARLESQCTVTPVMLRRRCRGTMSSAIDSSKPAILHRGPAARWDATAPSPHARHAAMTAWRQNGGVPAMRKTPGWIRSHRPRVSRLLTMFLVAPKAKACVIEKTPC